jgi:hypothetical protein
MKPIPCNICRYDARPRTLLIRVETTNDSLATNTDVSGPDAHYCTVCSLLVDWSRLAADYGMTLK